MKRHFVLFCSSLLILFAFIPKADDPVEKLISSIQKWMETNPQEKVYLHMDKPYYALGDTIWFKSYVTIGSRHQLSKMSGALYVELINEKDTLISSLKLPLMAGMAMGEFTLDDSYKAGNYRIRAYTQWMRNAGGEYFYDHTFAVGDPLDIDGTAAGQPENKVVSGKKKNNKKDKASSKADTDVQFFPEGGNLLNGVSCRIGFKAVGKDGKGLHVKGNISDQNGNESGTFESLYAGMGVFSLTPESGKTYQAKVFFADGTEKTVPLPKALEQGFALSIHQPDADSLLVRIHSSFSLTSTPRTVSLVVQSGGETIYASGLMISKPVTSIWLPKKEFPSGIAQFTLFDDKAEPLSERIAFIKSNDRMDLKMTSVKKSYSSRERIEIALESKSGRGEFVAGNFSVSVIDESKVPTNENNESSIFSGLLLSSDLKGYIETPNYYFANENDEVNRALDNLMLTQGYRRFVWKEILNAAASVAGKPEYPAESLSTEISGKVLTLGGKPVANGVVTMMSLAQNFMEQTKTDADGRFRYQPIVLGDSLKLSLQALTEKKGKKVEVILDEVARQVITANKNKPDFAANIPLLTKTYLTSIKNQDEIWQKTGRPGRVQRLKEVVIRAKKAANDYAPQGSLTISSVSADQTYLMENLGLCANLGTCLQGRLHGVVFRMKGSVTYFPHSIRGNPMQVIVDGRRMDTEMDVGDIFDSNVLEPADIVKIDVVRTNLAAISVLGGESIMIYTKRGYLRRRYTPNVINIKPKGFNNARVFYTPRHDKPGIINQLPDLRSTIYWNANVKTDADGKGRISFFNADGPGTYKVILEGINAAGELGRQVYRYQVTGDTSGIEQQVSLPAGHTDEITGAVHALRQRKPAEKLYLHTDKPYYNLGDTIWFKAYLLDASSLIASKKSGLLYVELNDDTAEAVRRISIPIKEGIGYAQIPLTSKIFHEGSYTLRAYTNWMKNFGSQYFFSKRFYLGIPRQDNWLVRSGAEITQSDGKDQLTTNFTLSRTDHSPVALREVELRIMEGDHELHTEKLQTSADGQLTARSSLNDKIDGRMIRAEIRSLHENDYNQKLLIPLNVAREQHMDVQFLPEGGYLVAGLNSKVGFKAVGEDGHGLTVKGAVYDSKNNLLTNIGSFHGGMGAFEFIPEQGETYTAKFGQNDKMRTFALPQVKAGGTVMKVTNEEQNDFIKITLSATADAVLADSTYYLIGTSGDIVSYAQTVRFDGKTLNIPKKHFPSGVTRFTLLRNKTPLNERIVFIDQHDELQFSVKTSKTSYYKRDSVDVLLEVKDKDGNPVQGSFSMAVTDNGQVRSDTTGHYGIRTSLLINANLKGTIENPGYYLDRNNKQRWQALDYLMLTQGWTSYDWKEVFAPAAEPLFPAQKYLTVSGRVSNILNKPVAGAPVMLSSQKPFFISNTITNEQGRYEFRNLPQIDSGSFFIQAKTKKGKSMNFGEVTVDKFIPASVPENYRDQQIPWYVNSDTTQLNYVKNSVFLNYDFVPKSSGIALKEVKITSKKIIKGSSNPNDAGNTDLVLDEEDIKESAVQDLYHLLKQKIPGFRVSGGNLWLNKVMMIVRIDGGGSDGHSVLAQLDDFTSDEELIQELTRFKIATFRGLEMNWRRKHLSRYYPGRIPPEVVRVEITTFSGAGWFKMNRPDFGSYRPFPVMHPDQFYSPKYGINQENRTMPDYRSTLYWKPDVVTDKNGTARISFYSSDITGKYSINIQGSDMDGRIGGTNVTLKIENKMQ